MSAVLDVRIRWRKAATALAGTALFAFGLAELYVPLAGYVEGEGPDLAALPAGWLAVLTVLLVGYGLAVAGCTSYPRTAAILAGACFTAQSFTPVLPEWPVVPLVALLAAAFGCVAVGGRAAPTVAAVAYFVSLGIENAMAGDSDWVFILFVGLAVLGPGYAVRMRRAQGARLVALAAEREAAARTDERLRVARELHDIVSHGVSVMVLQAGAAQAVLDSDAGQAHASLDAVQDVGREVVTELRRLLVILRGTEAAPEGLPSLRRIDPLTAGVRLAGGQVDVTVTGDLAAVPAAADVSGYRILQESLTNAARHAPGATVRVSIEVTGDALRLHVVDDGTGSARRSAGTGHGLTGIRERVELFGGTVSAGPRAQGGFEVRVELPFDADASAAGLIPTGVTG
ncbi:Signal transduction histidine kinase [Micromonospora viridifaciens]|uniref:histidine kinase n=1 Tax=Micromonospora viridifaciens TaxID=1881 RepID=A0A1C4VQF3_MICVI|nr:sensor histidine kinase [Micromonospora viridifaciens]SCE86183.1 Signal transduction histidine kinase [Micromonospora viridifaciens]